MASGLVPAVILVNETFAGSHVDFNAQAGIIAGGFVVSLISSAVLAMILFTNVSCSGCGGGQRRAGARQPSPGDTACFLNVACMYCCYAYCPRNCCNTRRLAKRVELMRREYEEEEAARDKREEEETKQNKVQG